ncbi:MULTISPECIES: OmpA family protein [unclassified Bradyrhizobium]|uniref:OmpA/MotB family protein n=1 Tax=unclassified Bradyrhizobium TaxID=2631580 RepID=UPI00247AC8F6|nr:MULTISPECIES: OmpA family protein [unclassified Bradyrhizobium]WGS18962.1 OmpA family protein [Bradyrhizobium sp. ISRA463]WGS25796.1 OmpA family protein [Bradyrhizobium sp. ISRA464]
MTYHDAASDLPPQGSSDSHEEGENYFISMTDMMVGVLFIFIILLMSFALLFRQQTDVQVAKTKVQSKKIEVAESVGRELDETELRIRRRLDEIREASELRLRLLTEVRDQLSREGLTVEISPSGDVLRLTEAAVQFPVNNFSLLGDAKKNVDKIAHVLSRVLPAYSICPGPRSQFACRNPDQASVETVFIEGHTDETGNDDQNWSLSAQRAASTYRELIAVAPELRRIVNRRKQEILSISGYSSTRPIDPSETTIARGRNRRIDLRFVMDTDPTSGLEEVQGLLQRMRAAIQELKGGSL